MLRWPGRRGNGLPGRFTAGPFAVLLGALVLAAVLLSGELSSLVNTTSDSGRSDMSGPAQTAVIEYVYDGDTIRVSLHGESTRIRLLNVDAPEEPRDGLPGECLADTAAEFLRDLVPRGSPVTLVFDDVRFDQYGRLLAGVYAEGRLVNAELARAGLVRPVVFDGNTRFLREVEQALKDAEVAGRGMFDARANCPF